MSGASTSAGAWWSHLEPTPAPSDLPDRPDDPRLGRFTTFWTGGEPELTPRRPVLIGFPQDEGVRRNGGRPGAAEAPRELRRWLYRLTPWDGSTPADLGRLHLIDLGDVRCSPDLEASQAALAEVVGVALTRGAVPIVLGGGHETAYGHYLGYVRAGLPVGIVNLDAHLDVRPCLGGRGHSGSPFRQAMEHPEKPLPGDQYACLGAQPQAVSMDHVEYVRSRGGVIVWAREVRFGCHIRFLRECRRFAWAGCHVHVTLDADVVRTADVPGVSAPNPSGLSGEGILDCVLRAGTMPAVTSFDLVEICPPLDRDGQSARWGALAVWQFLTGLAQRT
jgi:formiminoglutamase